MRGLQGNYKLQAETARKMFLTYPQEPMIARFHLTADETNLYILFFGSQYRISRTTGEIWNETDQQPAGFDAIMSIYDMLCDAKEGAVLSGEWRTIYKLTPYSNFSMGSSLHQKFAEKAALHEQALLKVCKTLGTIQPGKADIDVCFPAFSFFPLRFQFWQGDEEFAPQISFLFDANTLDFIRFETAWFVVGHLLELLDAGLDAVSSGEIGNVT